MRGLCHQPTSSLCNPHSARTKGIWAPQIPHFMFISCVCINGELRSTNSPCSRNEAAQNCREIDILPSRALSLNSPREPTLITSFLTVISAPAIDVKLSPMCNKSGKRPIYFSGSLRTLTSDPATNSHVAPFSSTPILAFHAARYPSSLPTTPHRSRCTQRCRPPQHLSCPPNNPLTSSRTGATSRILVVKARLNLLETAHGARAWSTGNLICQGRWVAHADSIRPD